MKTFHRTTKEPGTLSWSHTTTTTTTSTTTAKAAAKPIHRKRQVPPQEVWSPEAPGRQGDSTPAQSKQINPLTPRTRPPQSSTRRQLLTPAPATTTKLQVTTTKL